MSRINGKYFLGARRDSRPPSQRPRRTAGMVDSLVRLERLETGLAAPHKEKLGACPDHILPDQRKTQLHFPEVFMNELYRHGTFTDCRCNPLDGTGTHVSGGKDSRMARLQ
jgi:hypothetical protein